MADTVSATGAVPFPRDPARTAIVQMYRQPGMIADQVLPPTPALPQSKFKYREYSRDDAFIVPDTSLGRAGEPAQVEFSAREVVDETVHYGLQDHVPVEDQDAATGENGPDPVSFSAVQLASLLTLDREKRVADLVFNAASYGAGYKQALAADARFEDADTDVWGVMEDALTTPLVRPNVVVFGQPAWSYFRRHPKVLAAVNTESGAGSGLASRRAVAEVLEVDEVLVGRARVATNKQGQDLALSRVWGKYVACLYRGAYMMGGMSGEPGSEAEDMPMSAPPGGMPTFGFTARYRPMETLSRFNEGRGISGVTQLIVRESCKEVISGGSAFGYLLSTVVD